MQIPVKDDSARRLALPVKYVSSVGRGVLAEPDSLSLNGCQVRVQHARVPLW